MLSNLEGRVVKRRIYPLPGTKSEITIAKSCCTVVL